MPNAYPLATEMASTPKPPLHSSSPVPLALVPRIDRLDSIMKVLEDQKNAATTSTADLTRRKMPMDMAEREAQLKGSLMDRVRSLENRLLQLCLEIESDESSLPDTSLVQSLREGATSVMGGDNKRGSSYLSAESFKPTSDKAKQFPLKSQIHTLKMETKTEMNSEEEKLKNEGDEPKTKPTRSGKDHKIVGMKKKVKHSTWFHLKLLGC